MAKETKTGCNAFNINGVTYTEKEIISVLSEQIPRLSEYAHFAHASIEFCHENAAGDLFFYVTNDDGEDMMVKIGQDEKVYWDWTGPVMED